MVSDEDRMVASLIQKAKNPPGSDGEISVSINPEEHYNHYGDRGVVDLFVRTKESFDDGREYLYDNLYEVKSKGAVEAATGANGILRQYNRMREFFYRDESKTSPSYAQFELTFVACETTVNHVYENREIYLASKNETVSDEAAAHSLGHEQIFFRHPEDTQPIPLETNIHTIGEAEYFELLSGIGNTAAEIVENTLRDYHE